MSFSCSVIVADDGTHPLYDPISRHVDKCLELEIHAEYRHIYSGECGEDTVQYADEDGWEQHHDAGGDSHTVYLTDDARVETEIFRPNMDGVRLSQIYNDVEQEGADLSDYRGNSGAGHFKLGESEKPEYKDGVQDNIDDASHDEQDHGDLHLPDPLEDLFKSDLQQRTERKAKYNVGVSTGILQHCRLVREQ